MKSLIYSLIIIVFISCDNEQSIHAIKSKVNIVIIDSSVPTEMRYKYNPTERDGYYPIYYLGKSTDTICIGQKISGTNFNQKDYNKYTNFTLADSTKMKIIIDTSISLTHKVPYGHYSKNEEKWIMDSIKSYMSYPIFLYNQSDSLILIGNFSELGYTVRQAKNDQGNWVDIETPIKYYCGTGARDLVIEPNEIVVAMLLRYEGNFKTDCRLKFTRWNNSVYSNIFTDYIDKKQLTDKLKSTY